MISPSITAFIPNSFNASVTGKYFSVNEVRLRDISSASSPSTYATARYPSHFISYNQFSLSNASSVRVASIGTTSLGIADLRATDSESPRRVVTSWTFFLIADLEDFLDGA